MSEQVVPEEFLANPHRYFTEYVPQAVRERADLGTRLAGTNAIVQMSLEGESGGTWHFIVKDGAVGVDAGAAPSPTDLAVRMTVDTWRKLRRKELSGQVAFMTGQVKIQGNMGLAIKLGPLFN